MVASSSNPLQARYAVYGSASSGCGAISKDPPSGSELDAVELEDELNKLSLDERNSESSTSELPLLVIPTPTHTPPPITKITPPPGEGRSQTVSGSVVNCLGAESITQQQEPQTGAGTGTQVKEVQIELIESQAYEPAEEAASPPAIKVLELEAITPVSCEPADPGQEPKTDNQTTTEDPVLTDETEKDRERRVEIETVLEELSPTTDEYQEGLQFGSDAKDVVDDYDNIDADLQLGYIPPAPTPAPSLAPLAELDVDTVDDEPCDSGREPVGSAMATLTSSNEEARKRRKKRNSEGKRHGGSQDDKDKAGGSNIGADHNAVCPWEDELV